MTESDIELLVRNDSSMMDVLRAAEEVDLPDWWIGAGFLRNKVWDALEGNASVKPRDVDLVYFNQVDTAKETDLEYESKLKTLYPIAEWEVRNQARMHEKNGFEPYSSTAEGISRWVETATCVAVRIKNDELEFLYCHGSADLLGLIARPIPDFQHPDRIHLFHERIAQKGWRERWPHLTVLES